jgi:transposase
MATWIIVEMEGINVPCEAGRVIFKKKLEKEFQLFLYLKLQGKSSFSNRTEVLKESESILNAKSRTLTERFNRLIELGWIGVDRNNTYYLRSMTYIFTTLGLKDKHSVKITASDIPNFQEFLTAAFVSFRLRKQDKLKSYYKSNRKKTRVANKQLAADQRDPFFYSCNYTGMSSKTLSKLLGTSRSRAQRLLKRASQRGYIETKQRKKKLMDNLSSQELNDIKRHAIQETPEYAKRMRCLRFYSMGKFTFSLFLQLHNEINSRMKMKMVKKWRHFEGLDDPLDENSTYSYVELDSPFSLEAVS